MSAMEDATAVFAGLPGWDPFMGINLSCACATTKLVQCVNMGTGMCDVTRKFLNQSAEKATDLPYEDFMARKVLIKDVIAYDDVQRSKGEKWDWTPILYAFELAKGCSKRREDVPHMVFTDPTLTRFLMINLYGAPTCACGNPYHNDYAALTKMHANQFMCLVKYIYHAKDRPKPRWIRATYTTTAQKLNPAFLVPASTDDLPLPATAEPPIFNVTSQDFTPSLNDHHFQRIDALLSRSRSWGVPPLEVRQSVTQEEGTKMKLPKNESMFTAGKEPVPRVCAHCHNSKNPNKLMTCGRCKTVFYCNPKCQKEHWRLHKLYCKAPQLPKPSSAPVTTVSTSPLSTEPKPKREKKNKKKVLEAESSDMIIGGTDSGNAQGEDEVD